MSRWVSEGVGGCLRGEGREGRVECCKKDTGCLLVNLSWTRSESTFSRVRRVRLRYQTITGVTRNSNTDCHTQQLVSACTCMLCLRFQHTTASESVCMLCLRSSLSYRDCFY